MHYHLENSFYWNAFFFSISFVKIGHCKEEEAVTYWNGILCQTFDACFISKFESKTFHSNALFFQFHLLKIATVKERRMWLTEKNKAITNSKLATQCLIIFSESFILNVWLECISDPDRILIKLNWEFLIGKEILAIQDMVVLWISLLRFINFFYMSFKRWLCGYREKTWKKLRLVTG